MLTYWYLFSKLRDGPSLSGPNTHWSSSSTPIEFLAGHVAKQRQCISASLAAKGGSNQPNSAWAKMLDVSFRRTSGKTLGARPSPFLCSSLPSAAQNLTLASISDHRDRDKASGRSMPEDLK